MEIDNGQDIPLNEVIATSAEDTIFFGRVFFPRTFSMRSPEFHVDMAKKLDMPGNKVFKVFRGGAKTSITRVFTAKRISYAISRVIVIVGKGQDSAIKSILWLKNHIQTNSKWTETFKLSIAKDSNTGRPKKWTDEWITIYHGVEEVEIHVVAFGITGQLRGVNIDDFRPDFIICDDIIDDENAHNAERRKSVRTRFHGALGKSLAKKAMNPDASMVVLQTPIDAKDLCQELCNSPMWISAEYSCYKEDGSSQWEELFPKEELDQMKQEEIRNNTLSVWNREMEVKITSAEMRLFRGEWLSANFYEMPLRPGGIFILTVDPTPPPDKDALSDPTKLDDAVVMMTYFVGGHFYLVDYYTTKSPQTPELVAKIFEYFLMYRPTYVKVETVLFAKTIKESIETEMHERGIFFIVMPMDDKRNKFVRIKDTVQGLASAGRVHVLKHHLDFISQFSDYPQTETDDLLDAFSIATTAVNAPMLSAANVLEGEYDVVNESSYEELDFGGAP